MVTARERRQTVVRKDARNRPLMTHKRKSMRAGLDRLVANDAMAQQG
jgi:hypothetical protein